MKIRQWLLASVVMVSLFTTVAAQAQWVMVARAVSGQVQRMTNKSSNGSGYDVATVVLMANADKVYETALKGIQSHADVTINSNDAKNREIKFSKGDQIASMQATPLGDKITQLVIASNLTGAQPDATSVVVEGVMKVCKEMNVVCTMSQN
ncbi:MAG: hypothetical protein WA655_18275 [Candidatus Korobacteraceae bacterium]